MQEQYGRLRKTLRPGQVFTGLRSAQPSWQNRLILLLRIFNSGGKFPAWGAAEFTPARMRTQKLSGAFSSLFCLQGWFALA